jgi:acetoin:2,6-dichlorophenolindophenol oxidoreductase subunit alpha
MSIKKPEDVTTPVILEGYKKPFLETLFLRMVRAREFEEQLYYLFLTTKMPGTMHQATGQEAVAVGIASALNKDDYVTSTHRGHAHCIAKDVPLDVMMAEMFAKRNGVCKGMGGSMHLCDFSRGMLGAFGIVGAGIPIATGAALTSVVKGTSQVAVSFFGDGAINEGVFHESLNMAALWKLPVIYVIENNQYAFSMPNDLVSAVTDLSSRGCGYGIPGMKVDGNNVTAVYEAAKIAVEKARAGGGPTLIECITYRMRGHARFEPAEYRNKAEVEQWEKFDPIKRFKETAISSGVFSKQELEEIEKQVEEEIASAVDFANAGEEVGAEDYLEYIYEMPSEIAGNR